MSLLRRIAGDTNWIYSFEQQRELLLFLLIVMNADLYEAHKPADPKPGQHTRNWSLFNRLNQKGIRPQDKPIPIEQLNADEQAIIKRRYPELINEVKQQINYEPFIWQSAPPDDCPFEKSTNIVGIRFTGNCNDFHVAGTNVADTWYFSWASDDKLYSPFTDGAVGRLDGGRDHSRSWKYPYTTGQAIAEGDDPIKLKIYSLGLTHSLPEPYGGRYPCGSLVYCSASVGIGHFLNVC